MREVDTEFQKEGTGVAVHEREGLPYPFPSAQTEPYSTRFVGLGRSLVSSLKH